MILLPYEKFEIETSLSAMEARKRIETIVVPKPSFGTQFVNSLNNMFKKSGANQFTGKVDEQGFQISRLIYYHNSFLPVVKGKFDLGSAGTRINVTIALSPLVMVFELIWIAGVITIGVIPMLGMLKDGMRMEFLLPLGMLLFAWLLTQISFLFEAGKAKKIISDLFSAEPVSIQKIQ
jgi:hypothetical protein